MKKHLFYNIEVINFDKHNGRKEIENPVWFKVYHALFFNPKYSALSALDYALFVYLIALCSQKKNKFCSIRAMEVHSKLQVRAAKILDSFNILQSFQLINFSTCYTDVAPNVHGVCTREDKTRQEENIYLLRVKLFSNFWTVVLYCLEAGRDSVTISEAQQIDAMLKQYGEENLANAMIGMIYEKGHEGFNPKDHVSTQRLNKQAEKFINLGVKNKMNFISEYKINITPDVLEFLTGEKANGV